MKNRLIRQLGIHIGLWTGFIAILSALIYFQFGELHHFFFIRIFWGSVIFYINYLFLIPQFLFKKKPWEYAFYSLLVVIAMVLLPMVYDVLFNDLYIHKSFMRRRFVFNIFMQFFFFIAAIAVSSYQKWEYNEKKAQKLHIDHVERELLNLKNQINPHFLFNSLNSIYALTVKKSDQAPEAIITLSEMMRYMLYETDTQLVPIQKELDYIDNYIKLQKLRLTEDIKILFSITGKVENQMISPLLFISFIENAFKYGASSIEKTAISIQFIIEKNNVVFICKNKIGEDNIHKEENKGIGLKNTKERLELIYPDKHNLSIKKNDNEYIVNLEIQL